MDLIRKLFKAGYVEGTHKYLKNIKGIPQGSIIGPIISNIYLDVADKWLGNYIINFNRGKKRKANPAYTKIMHAINKAKTQKEKKALRNIIHKKQIPCGDPKDPNFKRLRVVRYADDILMGVIGSYADSIKIKDEFKAFLAKELYLTLSDEKTKVIFAINKAHFLATNIRITPYKKRPVRTLVQKGVKKNCVTTPRPQLLAPIKKIVAKLKEKGYCRKYDNRPTRNGKLIYLELDEIVDNYTSVARGLINYYSFADNYAVTRARILYILFYSCVLTIASKMRLKTKRKVIKKFGMTLKVPSNRHKLGFTEFDCGKFAKSKIQLRNVNIAYDPIERLETYGVKYRNTNRAFHGKCKICGAAKHIEMHHVNPIKNLKNKKRDFLSSKKIMQSRRQIPLCRNCHQTVHSGKYSGPKL